MSEVARLPDREPLSMLNLIARALHDDTDVDKLDRLLQMQERFEARELERQKRDAEQAFNLAMNTAQAAMRPVVRDAHNTQTQSRYARLETIDDAIRPIYTDAGFSLTYGTAAPVKPGNLRMICDCAHRDGHVRRYELEAGPDMYGAHGRPNKTELHGMGSTLSYLRRYLKMLIFDVVLISEDDDGNAGGGNIRNIADGMGENMRRETARRTMDEYDAGPIDERRTQRKAPTIGEWLAKFALQASLLEDSDAADKLITGEESLRMRSFLQENAATHGMSLARYNEIVTEVLQKWFKHRPEDDEAPIGNDGSDT